MADPFRHGSRFEIRALPLSIAAAVVTAAGVFASPSPASANSSPRQVVAVGAENEYANVIAQIGGRYVSVAAIMSDPNTDPHEFEASASVAEEVSQAQLIVQNGVGYDTFMNKIESATHRSDRQVIVAQELLGVASDAFNPHLWYDPRTMPAIAGAVATDLSRLEPAHTAYFKGNVKTFDHSLQPWFTEIANFKKAHPEVPVAVTEPVADYMLQAAGVDIKTPGPLQAAIMNGLDPSPQAISLEEQLLTKHEVKVFLYNQQVTDSLTATFLSDAAKSHVPVVGVYETMPTPGYDYQSWMMAETNALKLRVERDVYCKALMTSTGGPTSADEATLSGEDIALDVKDLSVSLSGHEILRGVSFSVAAGSLTGLIGENGAGKTTLLRAVLGLLPISAGKVRVARGHLGRRSIGYVPQKVVLDPDLPVRARDLVELGMDGRRLGIPIMSGTKRALVDQLLRSVDASHLADSRVGALSGGEQQRVLIAHALASQPQLLLLDEPLASLDPRSTQETAELLGRIARERKVGVLLSTHDINPLLAVMDRVVYLASGRAVSGRTDEVVRSDVLSALYRHHVDVFHAHGRVLVSVGEERSEEGCELDADDCSDRESPYRESPNRGGGPGGPSPATTVARGRKP